MMHLSIHCTLDEVVLFSAYFVQFYFLFLNYKLTPLLMYQCCHWFDLFEHNKTPFYGRLTSTSSSSAGRKSNQKPAWVVAEVIRLKAYLPRCGYGSLAMTFNRLHGVNRQMTVSRSYVGYTVRNYRLAILNLRRNIKHKKPALVPVSSVWGIDMTGKTDDAGKLHMIFGIIDHGARHLLALPVLINKTSWTLLGHLCLAIGKYGKPKAIRCDNERCFTSQVFTTALRCFGIRHQLIDLGCPWQNGRVERFF